MIDRPRRPEPRTRRPGRAAAIRALVAAAALLAAATGARAQEAPYPNRPITIIVPYAAGTPPDISARLFAEKLRPRVGQNVLIENKPGALTTLGMGIAARAKPDGYTLVYGSNSSLAAAPSLFKSLQYDPVRSFTAIAVIYETPMVLVGRPANGPKGFAGMIEQMRKEPGKHPIGGGAITQEVVNGMLQRAAGISQPYVRYSGSNLTADVMSGDIAMAVSALTGAAPMIEAGQLHLFAVTSAKRLPGKWAHVPTVAETLPGFDLTSWVGYWAPANTPRPIVKYLHEKTTAVLNDPAFRRRNDDDGGMTLFMTPEESDAFVRSEGPRWSKLMKDVGIEPQ